MLVVVFFVVTAFFFADEDFDALALDLDALALDFEALALDFEALAFDLLLRAERTDEREDLARRPRAERERVDSGRFQPTARSARTSLITFAGRRARAACTRFVSRTTNISRSGSIQSEVPVKPVCP